MNGQVAPVCVCRMLSDDALLQFPLEEAVRIIGFVMGIIVGASLDFPEPTPIGPKRVVPPRPSGFEYSFHCQRSPELEHRTTSSSPETPKERRTAARAK